MLNWSQPVKDFTLLVVDDDPAFRASVAAVLKLAGYDVVASEPGTAPETMTRLRNDDLQVIAIVVVDPRRPVGLELVQSFRKDADVLAIVGCCDALVRNELTLLGCDQVDKPVDRDALLDRVRRLIHRRDVTTPRGMGTGVGQTA